MIRNKNEKLKLLLFNSGTTQRELSKKTGISEAHISMIIRGKYNPDDNERQKIAAVVGCNSADIFNQ